MSASRSPEIQARQRRIARPWRIAAAAYALALVTATHWPNLTLGPEMPASDKTIHLVAFGTLTILIWNTRWLRQFWLVGLAVLIWAAIDEYSQGIRILHRTVSGYDLLANALGVTLAVTWIWALRPLGMPGAANQSRLKLMFFMIDEMFAQRRAWLAPIVGALCGGVPLLVVWWFLDADGKRVAITLAMIVSTLVTLLLWHLQWRKQLAQTMAIKPCLECGAPTTDVEPAHDGFDRRCATCQSPINPAQWVLSPSPWLRAAIGIGVRPAMIAFGFLIIMFGVILTMPLIYSSMLSGGGRAGWIAPRLARWIGQMPAEMTNVIDFAALFVLLAIVVRLYRGGLARFHDRAVKCLKCGHDLRGTPTNEFGLGRCGECGTAFVRAGVHRRDAENAENAEKCN